MQNDTIPEWAEKVAQDFHDKWDTGMRGAAFRDLVRAILAAEQRGRKAGMEEAAKVAESGAIITHVKTGEPPTKRTIEHRALIAAAIRQLGETT